jgi:hypothetical protein
MAGLHTIRTSLSVVALALIVLTALATDSQAEMYGFQCITNTIAGDAAIGQAQLSVDVRPQTATQQVLFDFVNAGPSASSITDIYFDSFPDSVLLDIASVINRDGVSFTQNQGTKATKVCPPDLPGGETITPKFEVFANFSADSDSPIQQNGVNPGESVGILFNLKSGAIVDNVISELSTGDLRIGIHVQGFDTGDSESFVNGPRVPLPGAVLLGGMGLGIAGWRLRGRKGSV